MTLFRGLIQLFIVYADSPARYGPCHHKLSILILDKGHASLLGNTLYGIEPPRVQDGVDQSIIEQFDHLLFCDHMYVRVEVVLWLPHNLLILFCVYVVHHLIWADVLMSVMVHPKVGLCRDKTSINLPFSAQVKTFAILMRRVSFSPRETYSK